MKHQFVVAFIGVLIVSLAGCAESTPPAVNEPVHTNEATVAQETPTAPTPLPPNVRKDSEGNLIKSDGWPIQEIIPKETWKRRATGKTKKGRTVIYHVLTITPEGRPVAEAAGQYSEEGVRKDFYVWRIRSVEELSGRDGKIFCYRYEATLFDTNTNSNGFATATGYNLCDYDGDGKYEFNGFRYPLIVPDWVKSLPGDPAAIDNNANREPDCGILCAK
ncbi:MAG: hypothetical protein QUS14_03270 [Pyrinomonadaceae bacterium]|nr:hypothetical protein [Pyrinomonadaceae bacterium]